VECGLARMGHGNAVTWPLYGPRIRPKSHYWFNILLKTIVFHRWPKVSLDFSNNLRFYKNNTEQCNNTIMVTDLSREFNSWSGSASLCPWKKS